MNTFLETLLPTCLRKTPPLEATERMKLLSTVPDTDNCLRAVEDLLKEHLIQEFMVAIDPQRDDLQKLRACEGMRVHYYALQELESERERAKEWVKQNQ